MCVCVLFWRWFGGQMRLISLAGGAEAVRKYTRGKSRLKVKFKKLFEENKNTDLFSEEINYMKCVFLNSARFPSAPTFDSVLEQSS